MRKEIKEVIKICLKRCKESPDPAEARDFAEIVMKLYTALFRPFFCSICAALGGIFLYFLARFFV
jgi:hypothetical protein